MNESIFVRQLGSNSKPTRDNALEKLQKYLRSKEARQLRQMQFDKLWKGLYFSMWFSDRPRPQQKLADKLGELHLLYILDKTEKPINSDDEMTLNDHAFIKFSRAFWKIITIQWLQIDRYRLDKYLLLMRRVFYNQLKYLQSRKWSHRVTDTYLNKVMKRIPLSGSPKVSNGIPMHIMDILLDEWQRLFENDEKSRFGELIAKTPLKSFLEIFVELLSNTNNSKVLRNKIKGDLLQDQRWSDWGFDVRFLKKEDTIEQEESEEFEEWHGF